MCANVPVGVGVGLGEGDGVGVGVGVGLVAVSSTLNVSDLAVPAVPVALALLHGVAPLWMPVHHTHGALLYRFVANPTRGLRAIRRARRAAASVRFPWAARRGDTEPVTATYHPDQLHRYCVTVCQALGSEDTEANLVAD